jgi:tetratricopeptide (TPR) repeat protein
LNQMKLLVLIPVLCATAAAMDDSELVKARDRQDRAALDKMAGELRTIAEQQTKDATAQYRAALAESYAAEVAVEMRDKTAAKNAAQAGIDAAERAVNLKPDSAEYQRILGTLCGQMISSNSLAALKYGNCALNAVNKAIELDPKSSMAFLSHGVGNYYLPSALGGGMEAAVKDFRKAIELNSKNADAWLWLGIALRRANQQEEARKAIAQSVELNPNRVWAKQQLDKTPAP